MLVCHCRVVNDRTIRAAVHGGACDLDGVIDRCGAGGACGGCIPSIEALLAEAAMAVRDPAAVAARQHGRRYAGGYEPSEQPRFAPATA